jgi:probable HAF family extracellular repeat protein
MRRSWVSVSVVILSCAVGVMPLARASSVTFVTIDVPDAAGTEAHGINDAGQIVGIFTDSGGKWHGYVATPTR